VTPRTSSTKLSALYYPYSRCVNLTALKALALLYEDIVFMDPLEETFREFLLSSDKGCQFVPSGVRERWRENQESWNLLREAGVLRTIDPVPAIREHDKLLTASYAADMADEAFVRTAEQEGRAAGPWKMLETRLPPSVNQSFVKHDTLSERIGSSTKAGRHAFSDYQIGVFAWERYDHRGFREYMVEKLGGRKAQGAFGRVEPKVREALDSSPLTADEQLFLSGAGTCTETGKPFGAHPYAYVDSVAFSTGEPIRILAFSQGTSLSISQALLLADAHGLTPVTDSPLHQRLLAMKYKRALANLPTDDGSVPSRRSVGLLEQYSIVARRVLLETLSPQFLSALSVRDLLAYRQENHEPLDRFWVKIRDVSHELDDVGTGDGFEGQLARIMDRSVLPELTLLSNELENSRRKMFGDLVAKFGTSVPASTALSVFAGLSGAAILALGAGAALTAFGMSLPNIMSYWQDKGKLGQNWLAIILDLRGKGSGRRWWPWSWRAS
jgi:hypothetical protein